MIAIIKRIMQFFVIYCGISTEWWCMLVLGAVISLFYYYWEELS